MRKVKVFERVRKYEHDKFVGHETVFKCTGLFHCWGVDYEEFETGAGNYTVAIVEFEDGKVDGVPPTFLVFDNSTKTGE